ncbi:hypothetical protein BKA64DRAFT_701517 [Cadophora sp. MPI-SDFR-AT-0126]|nr:hypothetical protein BKA64DRAFT_701517 [Leotiomycetes sp. MPI-SDFR-AT-0126]
MAMNTSPPYEMTTARSNPLLGEGPLVPIQPHQSTGTKAKGSKSTGTIFLLGTAVFLPFVAFSAVLLGLVFRNLVDNQASNFSLSDLISGRSKDLPGGYYLVDFPATRLIFISSWSNSIAPRAVGLATALWLFPVTAKLMERSLKGRKSSLPTQYQFSMLVGLSWASMSEGWKFIKYSFRGRSTPKKVSMVSTMFLVLLIGQAIAFAIFAVDAVLHFTTESVPYLRTFENSGSFSSFSQGLVGICTGDPSIIRTVPSAPCTYNIAATGEGFYDASELSATLNNISTSHQILSSIYEMEGTQTDLLVLGPPLTSIPNNLTYQASTVGVATSCTPASQLCNLKAPYGASTPFNCSDIFFGDLQIPQVNTTSTLWSDESTGNFLFGATFQDANFNQAYTNYSLDDTIDPNTGPVTINPFYMGIAACAAFGTNVTLLQNDPEITLPVHGGLAFILGCEVLTLDVTYTFFNNSIVSVDAATPSNGTLAWYFNSVMGAAGSLSHVAQGIDIAVAEPTAARLARAWSRSYSQEALSILASVHSARPNLAESFIVNSIVTRVARGPLLALVALNLAFAMLGAVLAVWAVVKDSSRVTAVMSGLGVEGLVSAAFVEERGKEGEGASEGYGKVEMSGVRHGETPKISMPTATASAIRSGWQDRGIVMREGPDPKADLRHRLLNESGRIGVESTGNGEWLVRSLI